MGELHLEIIVDRMRREFRRRGQMSVKPQVAYRETIRKPVDAGNYRFVKQVRRRAASTVTWSSKFEPQDVGKGFEFVDAIKGGVMRKEFMPRPCVRAWTKRSQRGVKFGYPVVDVKATLALRLVPRGGLERERVQDGRPSCCWKEAGPKGDPVGLLRADHGRRSPATPADYLGNVMGDLNSRRGVIMSQEDGQGNVKIIAPRCRSPTCSVIPRVCVPRPRAAQPYTMEFKNVFTGAVERRRNGS